MYLHSWFFFNKPKYFTIQFSQWQATKWCMSAALLFVSHVHVHFGTCGSLAVRNFNWCTISISIFWTLENLYFDVILCPDNLFQHQTMIARLWKCNFLVNGFVYLPKTNLVHVYFALSLSQSPPLSIYLLTRWRSGDDNKLLVAHTTLITRYDS